MATSRTLRQQQRGFPASLFVLLGLLSASQSVRSDEQVPLILWSSGGTPAAPQAPPSAGHIVEQQQLSAYLDAALEAGPRNVVLFLQDKMSVEDFTMYGGAFGNKQDSVFPNLEGALTSSSSPLVLPAVSWPASGAVIGQLQEQLDTSPLYMDPETLSQLRLNASSPALLVFRLPYGIGSDLMSAKEVLSGNDEVIGQVLSIMRTQAVPYTAVYTALRPSREGASLSLEAGLGGGRSLLQARGGYRERAREQERQRKLKEQASSTYSPVEFKEGERTCILLWARGLTVGILRGGRWEDHDLTPATFGEGVSPRLQGSSCNESIARLVLNYENVLGHRSFKLTFTMSQRFYRVSARRWFQMDAVELDYDGTRATFNGSRSVYAPAEYSFRCESVSSSRWPLLVPRSAKDPANQWRVSFRDFQVQGFSLRVAEFSYASDCAGFFSPGVWMGLLTGLLLLLLLLYGLHMVLQLRTMDRFDDPKGPAISVPQTE
ncbi:ATPase H+ transporting accessory protein 1a [Salarias fasciatus]|uniref:ATPase H+ transporting accessory protein 1a n=1 Tax=Salarias fasciatus TaxID=181472 RepID=UPI0011764BD1|nr:V-type proton ATPase subunit S1 [Salarias fasciatus]